MQGGDEWYQLLGGDASPGKRWRLIYTVGATSWQLADSLTAVFRRCLARACLPTGPRSSRSFSTCSGAVHYIASS